MNRRKSTTRGFVQTASLLTRRISGAGEKRGFAETRLLTRWAEIVGAEIAAIVKPVKVSYRDGFGATLTVLCPGPRAPEIEMQLPMLRDRVNACYGYNAISRIRLTQTAATGFAEARTPFDPKPPAAPDPEALGTLKTQLQDVTDTGLRAALAALGEKVLTRAAPAKPAKGTP